MALKASWWLGHAAPAAIAVWFTAASIRAGVLQQFVVTLWLFALVLVVIHHAYERWLSKARWEQTNRPSETWHIGARAAIWIVAVTMICLWLLQVR